ncbi:MAG: hypothetical protein U0U67_02855 [Chitinophagales bacterium]
MQKITSIIALLLIISLQTVVANDAVKILSYIDVDTDYEFEGVKGINITYKYNFLSLEEDQHNDTILDNCTFYLKTKLYVNGAAVKSELGYNAYKNSNGELEYSITLTGRDIQASKFDRKATQFIPYAAMQINEGEYAITINTEMTGNDATGQSHTDKKEKPVTFKKPATKIVTMNIDYIEVNTLNAKNQAWDYALFKTDAPDVGVDIKVGNSTTWKSHVNDTYMFAVGPNSKNIQFTISEKDKFAVLVQDIDVLFHDFVANLIFTTKDKKDGQVYTYDKASGNIKTCSLNFKIN